MPPDEYAAQMFRMSSVFPDPVVELAAGMGPVGLLRDLVGMSTTRTWLPLVQFLDIGTRAASDLR